MSSFYELSINGAPREIAGIPPDTSLLEVLRNDLGLKSPKFGCGQSLCGACTVLLNGRPTYACDTPIDYVTGEIETLEGLGSEEAPHALQTAFLDLQAGQCGYCIPGILMTATALLRTNPHPSRAEISAALDRNLCRCGTQQRFVDAVLAAATSTA